MSIAQDLIGKAERRQILFGIVGLGYVGLPLAVELAQAGYRVLGFDVNQDVVDGLNAGRSHVKDVTDKQLQQQCERFSATTDMSRLSEPDAISICVPTPLSKFKDPDVSYIVAATEAVKKRLRRGPGDHPGEHHLSRDHPGDHAPSPGEHRTCRGPGLLPGLQP